VTAAGQLSLFVPVVEPAGATDFVEQLRRFTFDGVPTTEVEAEGLRYFVNAFWTAGQRRGHTLHEISYRASFTSQLPG